MSDQNNAVDGIQPSSSPDRVDTKVADQTISPSMQSLNLEGLRDRSELSKMQVREFTHTGATQTQATSNAMTQMAAAGAKAVNYIMDGGK
ncbi:hypothetical protein TW84_10085 [Vibrio neptunius]|uniref:hypothetical protein n=1 Tax=Vibrio neptunius TaxID=170651 RepID=UPI0005FA5747|nr:hypothetical protein [Vibrio neptunius]KJY90541.1 hypothetical protein TW84_10085 [Vibrio neptunius]